MERNRNLTVSILNHFFQKARDINRRPNMSRRLLFRWNCCNSLNRIALFLLLCVGSFVAHASDRNQTSFQSSDPRDGQQENQSKEQEAINLISLEESIQITETSLRDPEVEKVRKQYWSDAFHDIRKLAGGTASNNSYPSDPNTANYMPTFLNQWKIWSASGSATASPLSNSTSAKEQSSESLIPTTERATKRRPRPQRFEGFPSWERMLADWSEEIQEYLEQANEDSEGGYALGNFGRAAAKEMNIDQVEESNSSTIDNAVTSNNVISSQQVDSPSTIQLNTKTKLSMPIPAPAKPGEAVLPHTDISDKSKRLLIVTTASLPWRTGTAVNALLRAAYLTKDRKIAGGSVTLMLPWLEREEDQHRVYGVDNVFQSPTEQTEYIRTWLRESANLQQASEELIVQWYTAWQNPTENSIYSMGDITALVSADHVDICILEEPEHLNW